MTTLLILHPNDLGIKHPGYLLGLQTAHRKKPNPRRPYTCINNIKYPNHLVAEYYSYPRIKLPSLKDLPIEEQLFLDNKGIITSKATGEKYRSHIVINGWTYRSCAIKQCLKIRSKHK